jgi:hypothetical protein
MPTGELLWISPQPRPSKLDLRQCTIDNIYDAGLLGIIPVLMQ